MARLSKFSFVFAVVLFAVPAPRAHGAEITNVIDAFDGEKIWDGILGLRFVRTQRSALLVREWLCQADDNVDVNTGRNPLCPDGNQIVDTRQLKSTESINVLNIDFRSGIYEDFEFYMTVPIVFGWSSKVEYDDGVSGSNSLVDTVLRPSLFTVPHESASRAGIGDLTLGLKLAPFHETRDELHPSWVLGIEYRAPTGSARAAGESNVGSGIHRLTFHTAISRRIVPWFDPYFSLHGAVVIPSQSGPFLHEVETQTLIHPGHSLGLVMGAEFHPWGEPGDESKYVSVNLAFRADFTFEGREFTDLFDPLGSSDCHPSTNCGRTSYTRLDPKTREHDGTFRRTDGVTDVEQYGRFGFNAGLTYQVMKHVRVNLAVNWWHTTSHFITFADAGKNLDGVNNVERSNTGTPPVNEYNPFYNESYDDFGRRFRVDVDNTMEVVLGVEGRF